VPSPGPRQADAVPRFALPDGADVPESLFGQFRFVFRLAKQRQLFGQRGRMEKTS